MAEQLEKRGRGGIARRLNAWRTQLLVAVTAWSCLTLVTGVVWTAEIAASPFGSNDPRKGEVGSYLEGLDSAQTGLVVAAIGLFGLVTAAAMRLAPERRWPAFPAVALGLILLVAVPDGRVIQNFAYLFFAYFGLWDGAFAAQLVGIVGGFLWVAVAATQPRGGTAGFLAPRDPRWGRAVTYTAAALALPYAVVRVSWALGIPLGVPSGYADVFTVPERIGIALVFGGLPTIGAVLTIGLIRDWGERFPLWMPFLKGRRVPIWFAVAPGLLAAAMIIQLGLRVTVETLRAMVTAEYEWSMWGESLPGVFILPWGLVLTAAVYAYAVRRLPRVVDGSRSEARRSADSRFG